MRKRYALTLALLAFSLAPSAFALPTSVIPESGVIGDCNFITGEMGFDCVPIFVAYLIEFVFAGIGTFSVIMMVYAGYEIALGGATGGTTDKGKQRLTWAIVGLIASILIFAIINFVISSVTAGSA